MVRLSFIRSYMVSFSFAVLLILTGCGEEVEQTDPQPGRSLDYSADIYFLSSAGDTVSTIRAAVADDDVSRSEGLMDVHSMPSDNGMIFIFEDEQERSFWMANTPLALDIIFANANKRIIRIHQNTRPYSDRNILSEGPAKYVIETNAGYTLNHDITEGMSFEYSMDP